jgi:zinc/manganese transport system substrate-binding protein
VADAKGSFMAADFVVTLEKPSTLDRSAGDIHPQGNPHVHLDPHRLLTVAKALTERLAQIDAATAATSQQRYDDFSKRWTAAMKGWEAKAAPLAGKKIIVHHASWAYLEEWLKLTQVGQLEPKPGVPPTSAHLSSLIETAKSAPAYAIVSAAYQDDKPGAWLAERSGAPQVVLPFTLGAAK